MYSNMNSTHAQQVHTLHYTITHTKLEYIERQPQNSQTAVVAALVMQLPKL
jgi:hypothetical protein